MHVDQVLAAALLDLNARLASPSDPTAAQLAQVDAAASRADVDLLAQKKQAISLGDRIMVAYAVAAGLPILSGDRGLTSMKIDGLRVDLIR